MDRVRPREFADFLVWAIRFLNQLFPPDRSQGF